LGNKSWIWSLSFSRDGRFLATAGCDGTARIWDILNLANPVQVAELYLDQVRVNSTSFSHDGKTLVLGVSDGTVRLWEPKEFDLNQLLRHGSNWLVEHFAAQPQTLISLKICQTRDVIQQISLDLVKKGLTLAKEDKISEAVEILKIIQSQGELLDRQVTQDLLVMGRDLAEQGKIKDAIKLFKLVSKEDSSLVISPKQEARKYKNIGKAKCLVSAGREIAVSDSKQAVEKFTQAIALTPDCKDALIERSRIYIEAEQYEKALSDLSKLIALTADVKDSTKSPSDKLKLNEMTDLYTCIGVAYSGLNNFEKAKESFLETIDLYQSQGIPNPGERLGQICTEHIPSISQYWKLNTIFTELISSSDDKVDLLKSFAGAQQNLGNYLGKLYKLQLADSTAQFPSTTPIVVEVGDEIVPIVDNKQDEGHFIYELIPQMRDRIKTDFGINIPGIRLRANPNLAPEDYLFMIDEVPIARGNVHVGMYFFEGEIDDLNEIGIADQALSGIHPLTHKTGYWVPDSAQPTLQAAGHDLIPAPNHLLDQFEALIRRNLVKFFGIQEAETLLQSWESSETGKSLVTAVAAVAAVAALHLTSRDRLRLIQVLRELIRDRVPLTQGETILSALQGANLASDDIYHLTQLVRLELRQHLPGNAPGTIRVPIPLAEEQTLFTLIGDHAIFIASPQQKHEFLVWLRDQLQELQADLFKTVLVTPNPASRPLLRRLIEPEFPDLMVLSQEEVLEFSEATSSCFSDESPTTNLSKSPSLTANPTPDDQSEEVTECIQSLQIPQYPC
jgi:tetratricopeptide (TPR) repeat protein